MSTNYSKFDVLKEGSYLLHEFEPIVETENAQVPSVLEGNEEGLADVDSIETSPLFHLDTLVQEADVKFLKAITDKVPYYHSQGTTTINGEGNDSETLREFSDARDPSINDVHAALRDDPFWKEWFSNLWGDEQNKLLLEAYNRLQFPYINENQYLNAEKFKDLAKNTPEGEEATAITFKDNSHLKDIVEERLQAIYSLLNYSQLNPQFIEDWAESLWRSGACTKEEAEKEKSVFKLQDVKNEILRRKFAGSSSLYKMILNSIDRQGTLAKTTLLAEESSTWQNGRPVRALDLDSDHTDIEALKAIHENDGVPLDLTLPMFYESSVEVDNLDDATRHLRTEKGTLDWDAPEGEYTSDGIPDNTVLDIQADHILYHQNSIQKKLGASYPLPVDPSTGASLSLMDSTWMDYVKDIAKDRQRPSEEIKVGTQISLVAEDKSFQRFTFSTTDFKLMYGTHLVAQLYEDNGIYKSPVPFIHNGAECIWSLAHGSLTYRLSDTGPEYISYINPSTGLESPILLNVDASSSDESYVNFIKAQVFFLGSRDYSCTVDNPITLDGGDILVSASNSAIPGASLEVTLDDSEITLLEDVDVVGREEDQDYIALNTLLTDNVVSSREFKSGATAEKDGDEISVSLNLPPVGATEYSYTANVTPSLSLKEGVAFADSIQLGTNLTRSFREGKPKVHHNTRTEKQSSRNFIVLPFVASGNISKLNLYDCSLSFIFNILTSADSYYTEMRYPIPSEFGGTTSIAYKWTGIRTLKEGSYYITCKYPALVTPYTEEANIGATPVSTVLASRFKITVQGQPKSLIYGDTADLDPTLSDYTYNTLESKIKPVIPEDNKSFPHRYMNIKLYVQDTDNSGSLTWTLIGSNDSSDAEDGVILLKRNPESPVLVPQKAIPAFIVPSYTSGFYTEGENGAEASLSSLELEAGESYRFILDYTANITEFSYCENIYTNSAIQDEIRDYSRSVDLLDSNALVKEYVYSDASATWTNANSPMFLTKSGFFVKDNEGAPQWDEGIGIRLSFTEYEKPDCIYLGTTNFENLEGETVTGIYDIEDWTSTSGYPGDATVATPATWDSTKSYYTVATEVVSGETLSYWKVVNNFAPSARGLYKEVDDEYVVIASDERVKRTDDYYVGAVDKWILGNPYSESSDKNSLLGTFANEYGRSSINDCPFIPYLYEGVFIDDTSVSRGGFRATTKTLDRAINKSELEYARDIYSNIRSRLRNAITSLTENPAGVFQALGSSDIQETWEVGDASLVKRTSTPTTLPSVNLGEEIVCDELYGSNLIQDNDFNNLNTWTLSKQGAWYSDNSWKTGKDVYKITVDSRDPISFKYFFDKRVPKGVTECSICLKNAAIVGWTGDNMDTSKYGSGWKNYHIQSDEIVNEEDMTITFEIVPNSATTIYITKPVCRVNHETRWIPGLSNSYLKNGTSLNLPSFSYLSLKADDKYIPFLLKSRRIDDTTYVTTPTSIEAYTEGLKLFTDEVGYTHFVAPWERKLKIDAGVTSQATFYEKGLLGTSRGNLGADESLYSVESCSLSGAVATLELTLEDFFSTLNVDITEGEGCFFFRNERVSFDTADSLLSMVKDDVNGDLVAVDTLTVTQGSNTTTFKFLPIVYNRRTQHLSVNVLVPLSN